MDVSALSRWDSIHEDLQSLDEHDKQHNAVSNASKPTHTNNTNNKLAKPKSVMSSPALLPPSRSMKLDSITEDKPVKFTDSPSLPSLTVKDIALEATKPTAPTATLLRAYDSFPVLAKPSSDESIESESGGDSEAVERYSTTIHAIVLRFMRHFAKGITIGFAGKAGFALLGLLIRAQFSVRRLYRRDKSYLGRALVGEPLSYGAFLGTMLAIYQTMSKFWHRPRPLSVGANVVAGLLIAPSLYLLPRSHRASITLFFFVRAVECLLRYWTATVDHQSIRQSHSRPPSQPWWYQSQWFRLLRKHADTLVFCLASMPICWSALYDPQALDSSYYSFLTHHGGKSPAQLSVAAKVHGSYSDIQPSLSESVQSLQSQRQLRSLSPLSLSQPFIHCQVLHPGQQCHTAYVHFFLRAYQRAVPVYLPVYIIPLLLFRLKSLRSALLQSLVRLALSIGRSAFFLSSYCSIGWSLMCAMRHVDHHYGRQSHAALSGFLSGLTLLIEKPARRIELALYVANHALLASYQSLMRREYVPHWPHALFVLYGASLSVMFVINNSRLRNEALRPSYQSIFNYFFGAPTRAAKHPQQMRVVNGSGHDRQRALQSVRNRSTQRTTGH